MRKSEEAAARDPKWLLQQKTSDVGSEDPTRNTQNPAHGMVGGVQAAGRPMWVRYRVRGCVLTP